MALHHDLLAQARLLATHEPRKPKQASLRRAISTAYYALFHLLTSEAAGSWLTGAGRDALRASLRRAFDHSTMRRACQEIVKPNEGKLHSALCGVPCPPRLKDVAAAFVELQQARHEADYDVTHRYTRREALEMVMLAEGAFDDWRAARNSIPAEAFLAALIAERGMGR